MTPNPESTAQCCGNCKWFGGNPHDDMGPCQYPKEKLPARYHDLLGTVVAMTSKDSLLALTCPCFAPKESSDAQS